MILLDGAGSFGPLLDNKKRLYNLDHHTGCERTFTLATCEQALLLVHGGLDLSEGDWSVYANEPDLDTLLALWCLLNHARLRDLRPQVRDMLLPMIRLEGAIDANGNELAEVCGLPAHVLREAQRRLDHLLAREQQVKGGGDWQTLNLEAYAVEMLGEIDRMIYVADDFRGYANIEEVYGHTALGERRVSVVCRDSSGIYAVEKLLKERWGDQLGLIALEKEPGHYTLRRASTLSDIDLDDAYRLLNLLDRNVDGRPPGKRWGGSDNIGGSPRPLGSALSPSELLRVLGLAYRSPKRWQRPLAVARVALLVAGLGAFGAVAGLGASALPEVTTRLGDATARIATFSLFVGAASWLLSWLFSGRRLWLYGWRRPAGAELAAARARRRAGGAAHARLVSAAGVARSRRDRSQRRRGRTRGCRRGELVPGARARPAAARLPGAVARWALAHLRRGVGVGGALRGHRGGALAASHLGRAFAAPAAGSGDRRRRGGLGPRGSRARHDPRALALPVAGDRRTDPRRHRLRGLLVLARGVAPFRTPASASCPSPPFSPRPNASPASRFWPVARFPSTFTWFAE